MLGLLSVGGRKLGNTDTGKRFPKIVMNIHSVCTRLSASYPGFPQANENKAYVMRDGN